MTSKIIRTRNHLESRRQHTQLFRNDHQSHLVLTIILITINVADPTNTCSSQVEKVMYVCICKGITDTQIRAAVEDGASSMRDVRNTLGVASQCGKCGILTREIVRESLNDIADNEQLFYAVS
jgi:bacterioferritin-associated ferredoxin